VIADVAPSPARTFLATSANVIVESVRRDRNDLEVRLVECLGRAGKVDVTVSIPHRGAAITDLTGSKPVPLKGGPQYQFAIRAQQIVTLRFRTAAPVGEVRPLLEWDPLVPAAKRPALHEYSEEKGHPPRG
jgi:hypothetical protein